MACLVLLLGRWWLLWETGRIPLLADGDSSRWIQRATVHDLETRGTVETRALYRRTFVLAEPVVQPTLQVRAFRRFQVWLDQDFRRTPPGFTNADDTVVRGATVPIRGTLAPGEHTLYVFVTNRFGPACLDVSSPDLDVDTGSAWRVLAADESWQPVRCCSDSPVVEFLGDWPDTRAAGKRLWPIVTFLFLAALAGNVALTRSTVTVPMMAVRITLHLAWAGLCLNNMFRIGPVYGFDLDGHMHYVDFIVTNCRLPLPTEGWTMFQPPLFYLLAAPLHAVVRTLPGDLAPLALRIIPMLCGAVLIETGARAAHLVFPGDRAAETWATVVAGCLPILVYQCQLVHNEPLAAALAAVTILGCLDLVVRPDRPRAGRFFLGLGVAWGMSVLAKLTPIILAPTILGAIVWRGRRGHLTGRRIVHDVLATLSAFAATCGWYFLWNWYWLGRPVVTGFDRQRGIDWWQDPGYRTWTQILSFGRSFEQPIYAGCWSLTDAIYSTLWTDGWLSGTFSGPSLCWGNAPWLVVLPLLGLLPGACILLGVGRSLTRAAPAAVPAEIVALAVVGTFLASICDLWLQLPIYATCKSTYMLGAAPCLGILAGSGAMVIDRARWARPILAAGLATWAVAVYAAFFCMQ